MKYFLLSIFTITLIPLMASADNKPDIHCIGIEFPGFKLDGVDIYKLDLAQSDVTNPYGSPVFKSDGLNGFTVSVSLNDKEEKLINISYSDSTQTLSANGTSSPFIPVPLRGSGYVGVELSAGNKKVVCASEYKQLFGAL